MPLACSPSQATAVSGSSLVILISPNSPRWRASDSRDAALRPQLGRRLDERSACLVLFCHGRDFARRGSDSFPQPELLQSTTRSDDDDADLASTDRRSRASGLGCMGMSGMYGPAERDESIATIHAALDAGINLLDTGDFYGMGHNELLIGEALRGARPRRDVADQRQVRRPARPGRRLARLRRAARRRSRPRSPTASSACGVDHIDVYRPARLDPKVPIEETVGAIAEMVQAGYVRYIGLSEVGAETIRRAAAVHPICDLQIEYSLISRGIEREILPTCRELGSRSPPTACSRAA